MNIRKKILTRCGALLTAVLVLAPTALAAEAEIPYIPQTVPAAQLAPADQRGQEDWQLLLVNPWHTVPEGYEIKLATLSNGLQVDERIYDDLDDMLSDCREAGLNPIVCSAYRTEATQTRLYRNKVARVRASGVPEDRVEAEAARWVAKPGTSEHQTGLAIDLGEDVPDLDFIRPSFPDSGACGAFRRAAARYGFLQRYCREKEALTGIAAEPWHFRYVGAPHAQLMETNGLCLEEYRDFLRQGPRSVALENGRMAQVFYVPAAGAVTEVEVPEGCCQISGDNVEGFILTWWGDTHENG